MMEFLNLVAKEVETETREESLWYLVGALGDGTMYYDNGRYVVEYGQKCADWLIYAIGLRIAKLGAKPYLVRHKLLYWKIKAYSKALYYELSRKREMFRTSPPTERSHMIKLIRGFFDAEGTISKQDKNRVYIRISQKDRELLRSVANMLNMLGIKTTEVFRSDSHGTYVLQIRSRYVKDFVKVIGTNHPLKYERIKFFFPNSYP